MSRSGIPTRRFRTDAVASAAKLVTPKRSAAPPVGLTVPMIVRGPLTKPSVSPDPGGTALGIAKTAGLIVFPPAGLAAIIERSKTAEGNACVAALKKVDEGGGPLSFFADAGKAIGDTVDSIGKGAGDAIDTIGEGAEDAIEGLKGLFGN